jgi:hypothetical protein
MATYGTYNSPGAFKLTVYGVVIALCFFAMFYMVRSAYREYKPQPINQARALERAKVRKDLTDKATAALNAPGWVDQAKGIVRLPIARAMQMTIEAYQNPEAAHSNLVNRSQKAAAPAPVQSFE